MAWDGIERRTGGLRRAGKSERRPVRRAGKAERRVAVSTVPLRNAIPESYFGTHLNGLVRWGTRWPTAATVTHDRLWDSGTGWPISGSADEACLDKTLAILASHGSKAMLTIGRRGKPAPTTQEWHDIIDGVTRRYKGQLEAIEMWNEPDAGGEGVSTGLSVAHLLEMARVAHDVARANDPTVLLVGPACQSLRSLASGGFLDQFLAGGGGQYLDVISHHFYDSNGGNFTGAPLKLIDNIKLMRALLQQHGVDKPIWNTEFNWLASGLDSQQGTAFMMKAIVLGQYAGLARLYWYSYDGSEGYPRGPGIVFFPENVVAQAYGKLRSQLVGSTLGVLRENAGWVVVPFTDKSGVSWELKWNDSTQPVPSAVQVG